MTDTLTPTTPGAGRLAGQTAIITGASRGIGLAIAQAFAAEGARLLLVATKVANLEDAKTALANSGAQVETMAADVGDAASCREVVSKAEALLGGVDILVNGAAVYKAAPFLSYRPEDFEEILRVNLYGTIHMMQAVLPAMVERKYGRVVNVASTAGKWASRNQSPYNTSKHAVIGLTRCTALEFATSGVTVNALCPGMVQTDLADQLLREHAALGATDPESVRADLLRRIPQARFLDPQECGSLAVYLASRESRGMTGQSIVLDGGMLFV